VCTYTAAYSTLLAFQSIPVFLSVWQEPHSQSNSKCLVLFHIQHIDTAGDLLGQLSLNTILRI